MPQPLHRENLSQAGRSQGGSGCGSIRLKRYQNLTEPRKPGSTDDRAPLSPLVPRILLPQQIKLGLGKARPSSGSVKKYGYYRLKLCQ